MLSAALPYSILRPHGVGVSVSASPESQGVLTLFLLHSEQRNFSGTLQIRGLPLGAAVECTLG